MTGLILERPIESSAIPITIFSKGYAESRCCLKEAAVILSIPDLIIPLFYPVDSTDFRYPEKGQSPYQKSFLKQYDHSDRYAIEDIEGWTNAHKQIHSRSDWSMDITQGFEAWLGKTVVNFMIKALDGVPVEVTKHPVGMDSMKNALIENLNLNLMEEAVKAGIWVLAVSARQQLQRLCTIGSIVVSMLLVLYLMYAPLL